MTLERALRCKDSEDADTGYGRDHCTQTNKQTNKILITRLDSPPIHDSSPLPKMEEPRMAAEDCITSLLLQLEILHTVGITSGKMMPIVPNACKENRQTNKTQQTNKQTKNK